MAEPRLQGCVRNNDATLDVFKEDTFNINSTSLGYLWFQLKPCNKAILLLLLFKL